MLDNPLLVGRCTWISERSVWKKPKSPIFNSQKLLWNVVAARKTPRIWRDLVESYSRHILKLPNSNSEFQKFSSQVSDKSEKSMRIIDFLPKYHWFPSKKCLKNQWRTMKTIDFSLRELTCELCHFTPGQPKLKSRPIFNMYSQRAVDLT